MKRDWVKECITGQRPAKPVVESKASANVRAILGERDTRPPTPDAGTRPPPAPTPERSPAPPLAASAAPAPEPEDDAIPAEGDVTSLITAWQSGSQMTVAQHVLDGLPSYRDFVSLVYGIGQEGAMQLAAMMDELSASADAEGDGTPALPPSREVEGDADEVASPDDQLPVR